MDDRIVEFIAALRAAGVRVSVAESADALRAIEATGIVNKDLFRMAMRATLVKEAHDQPTFEELFPLYFGSGQPPMQQPGGGMSGQEREQMLRALAQMLRTLTPEQLRRLFESMMTGQPIDSRELREMIQGFMMPIPLPQASRPWQARSTMRAMQFDRLNELLEELLEKLRQAGVSEEALRQLEREARENQGALGEQISREVGASMARQAVEEQPPRPQRIDELMDRPFESMSQDELADLRSAINRLAAQLRTRAALRQKRGNKGTLDAKSTLRANQSFGGVPFDVRYKRRHLKPKLVLICDRSRSTESVVRFLLTLIYTLQDQVSRTRSFAFIDTIYDISTYFDELRPEQAIDEVMQHVCPTRSYSTDLGQSLNDFMRDYGGCVDHRTTVIILGDARNNENDPRLDTFEALRRRARRIVWFNPEPPHMWGRYDPGSLSSDMLKYLPLCSAVHHVSNLRQLVQAVDTLFTYR